MESLLPPLRLRWKRQFKGYIWASPVVQDRVVVVPGPGKKLFFLDLGSGHQLEEDPTLVTAGNTTATIAGRRVFVCGKDGLRSYAFVSRKIEWGRPSRIAFSTPCAAEDLVLWGSIGGDLNAADVESGEIRWTQQIADHGNLIPASTSEMAFVSGGKTVDAIYLRNGNVAWKYTPGVDEYRIQDPVAFHEGVLLVSIGGIGLVALGSASGDLLWEYRASGVVTSASVSNDGMAVFVAGPQLHAVNLASGKGLWVSEPYNLATSCPITVGGHIFIGGGFSRAVYGFDRSTGERVWEYPTKDLVFSTPAYDSGSLLIGSHDGNVYCFSEAVS